VPSASRLCRAICVAAPRKDEDRPSPPPLTAVKNEEMKNFLYVFGYWTPEQRRQNELHGWDDEDSAALLVDAETEAQALEWGRDAVPMGVCEA
jgi:hypothetical protein